MGDPWRLAGAEGLTARAPEEESRPGRIASIDLIRGAVMILMALDHVRVYAGVPAGGPTAGIFFTRWITHVCAPAFVFLAGTSAFLHGRRHAGLSRFLLLRGAWLILLELTILRAAWTFNAEFTRQMAGVIWMIGWCMIVLAGLVRLPAGALAALGLVIVAGHNLIDPWLGQAVPALGSGELSWLWKILYLGFHAGPIGDAGGVSLTVLYSLIPWIGVMALGYVFGRVVVLDRERRDRICLSLGLGAIALFLALRGLDLYGDPRPWSAQAGAGMPWALAFLNTTKYPASLSFLLMTLGPAIAAIPLLEKGAGPAARAVAVFGRVPFFYYVLHIPLIHMVALLVSQLRLGRVSPWLFANHPMGAPPAPPDEVWSLALLYVVWGAAVLILYPACRWFARVKSTRKHWWLSYL